MTRLLFVLFSFPLLLRAAQHDGPDVQDCHRPDRDGSVWRRWWADRGCHAVPEWLSVSSRMAMALPTRGAPDSGPGLLHSPLFTPGGLRLAVLYGGGDPGDRAPEKGELASSRLQSPPFKKMFYMCFKN